MSVFSSEKHIQFLKSLRKGSLSPNRELKDKIKNFVLTDDTSSLELAKTISVLLTKRSFTFSVNMLGPSQWREDLLNKKFSNSLMTKVTDEIERSIFLLYEENFGSTRETILYLDGLEDPHVVPYLNVFIRTAVKNIFNSNHQQVSSYHLEKLFDSNKLLLNWVKKIIASEIPLKHFGGQTNTRIGLYSQLFKYVPELNEYLDLKSDHSIDLGGGFATPEISELFGCPFVSYDLVPPQNAELWGLHFGKSIDTSEHVEDDLWKKLQNQKFQYFDVFQNDFPSQYHNYNIVSFGFLNSTVTSLSASQPSIERPLRKFNTLFFSVYKLCRLAALGKKINFITYGRPDLSYMNRLLMMKFEDNKVIDISIPGHYLAYQPFSQPGHGSERLSTSELINLVEKEN